MLSNESYRLNDSNLLEDDAELNNLDKNIDFMKTPQTSNNMRGVPESSSNRNANVGNLLNVPP